MMDYVRQTSGWRASTSTSRNCSRGRRSRH